MQIVPTVSVQFKTPAKLKVIRANERANCSNDSTRQKQSNKKKEGKNKICPQSVQSAECNQNWLKKWEKDRLENRW